jgi:hypothetical protein
VRRTFDGTSASLPRASSTALAGWHASSGHNRPVSTPNETTEIVIKEGREPFSALIARSLLDPSMQAAISAKDLIRVEGEGLDISRVREELEAQCRAVAGGDLSRAESMLVAQMHSLDALFNMLVRCSARNLSKHLDVAERYMRLALKAQSQARATVETLTLLKNPTPTVFAKQANVTSGPQQVNNGPRAEPRDFAPTELSGGPRELLQDARASAAAFGTDSTLEAVGEVHRPAHARRQGKVLDESMARRAPRGAARVVARVPPTD